jgi:hypothetical protein
MIETNAKAADKAPPELTEAVRRHQVCWEESPLFHYTLDGEKMTIGFDLGLYGTHDHPQHPLFPGCEECSAVHRALEEIAQWIIPKKETESQYEIEVDFPALVFSRLRENRPEVKLTIKIMHRSGFDRPVDACEIACIQEMEAKLEKIGAKRGKWQG